MLFIIININILMKESWHEHLACYTHEHWTMSRTRACTRYMMCSICGPIAVQLPPIKWKFNWFATLCLADRQPEKFSICQKIHHITFLMYYWMHNWIYWSIETKENAIIKLIAYCNCLWNECFVLLYTARQNGLCLCMFIHFYSRTNCFWNSISK